MNYLVVSWGTEVVTPEVLDGDGNVVTPAVTQDIVSKVFLVDENRASQIPLYVEAPHTDIFELEPNPNRQTVQTHKLRVRPGARAQVTKEIEVIENADGDQIATREV